jgi:dTDP-glucose pyrophosphorylase
MNILILAAGEEQETGKDGYPLCLEEIDSVPLIQRVMAQCEVFAGASLVVALRQRDVQKFHLENVISLLRPDATTLSVREGTHGALCTALLAVGLIDNDEDLLIINGNELLTIDFSSTVAGFRQRELDAGVVIFDSIHPRYSYVRCDENGQVVEAAEKKPISRHATVGFYWFASGATFVAGAKRSIRRDARVNNNFYICPVLNELILDQKRVGAHEISGAHYHPLKSPKQIGQFEFGVERRRGA